MPPSVSTVSAPAPVLRLDPVRGNLHEFLALDDTAIFDVLLPPYSDRAGRSCRYYAAEPEGAGGVDLVEVYYI